VSAVRLPKWLLSRATSLSELGLDELAWRPDDALLVVSLLPRGEVAVLGGDVYAKRAGKIEPLYENWYVNTQDAEQPSDFARRSQAEANAFLSALRASDSPDRWVTLVLSAPIEESDEDSMSG
jgi:hypothetical protein